MTDRRTGGVFVADRSGFRPIEKHPTFEQQLVRPAGNQPTGRFHFREEVLSC